MNFRFASKAYAKWSVRTHTDTERGWTIYIKLLVSVNNLATNTYSNYSLKTHDYAQLEINKPGEK